MNSARKFWLSLVIFFIILIAAIIVVGVLTVFAKIKPVSKATTQQIVAITPSESATMIARSLGKDGLIRSPKTFELLAEFADKLGRQSQPGTYYFSASMSSWQILSTLHVGPHQVMRVTIPEGLSVFEIDDILAAKGILQPGQLIAYARTATTSASLSASASSTSSVPIEGRLFPDTYDFYTNSTPQAIVAEMMANFQKKALPLLEKDPANIEQNLILASILEKEVPDQQDQEIVAGILEKRIAANIPLEVDATICYIKKIQLQRSLPSCEPLSPLDFKIDSPYNTYLYRGWPPGPIGNPGLSAVSAALAPQASPYWYYLSDPATGKTIFAETLEEQNKNREEFLSSP